MLVVRLCIFCFLVFLCLFHFDSPSSRVCFVQFCFPCLLAPVCIYCPSLCPRVFHHPVFQPSSWVPGWVLSMWVFSPALGSWHLRLPTIAWLFAVVCIVCYTKSPSRWLLLWFGVNQNKLNWSACWTLQWFFISTFYCFLWLKIIHR